MKFIYSLSLALASLAIAAPALDTTDDSLHLDDSSLELEVSPAETEDHPSTLFKRGASCGKVNGCNISDADTVCTARLKDGATNRVPVGKNWVLIERYNTCYIWGRARNVKSTSSYYRDVYSGAKQIEQTCKDGFQRAGYNYAGGNGDFEIYLGGKRPKN